MQIILLEKVINLGTLGDVVRVKDGYARNFLIPQGKAKRATTANLADFEKRRAELEKAHAEVLAQAQDKATKIEGMMVQITQKAGVDGKLFGSVTNSDVSEALKKQGIDVPKPVVFDVPECSFAELVGLGFHVPDGHRIVRHHVDRYGKFLLLYS